MENSNSSGAGKFDPCGLMKLLGYMLCCCNARDECDSLDTKVQRKMIGEGRKGVVSRSTSFRSINGIIMKFPQFKEDLQKVSATFHQFDKDCNGIIDRWELSDGLRESGLNLTEEELDDLLCSCDGDGKGGVHFNEFVVLLGLIYILTKPSSTATAEPSLIRLLSPQLESTFDSVVEAFLFMDKNGDGRLNKTDMFKSMIEAPWERPPASLTWTRFKEMDRDKSGTVNFREFLFALTTWLELDTCDELPVMSP